MSQAPAPAGRRPAPPRRGRGRGGSAPRSRRHGSARYRPHGPTRSTARSGCAGAGASRSPPFQQHAQAPCRDRGTCLPLEGAVVTGDAAFCRRAICQAIIDRGGGCLFAVKANQPHLMADIASRPTADIITEICRDLGLAALPGTRPFKRRTPDDIRQLCARAAAASPARQSGPAQAPRQRRGPAPPPARPRPPAARAGPGPRHPPRMPAPARAANDPPSSLPDDPAEAIATILRHPAGARSPWHPPPRAWAAPQSAAQPAGIGHWGSCRLAALCLGELGAGRFPHPGPLPEGAGGRVSVNGKWQRT